MVPLTTCINASVDAPIYPTLKDVFFLSCKPELAFITSCPKPFQFRTLNLKSCLVATEKDVHTYML